MKSNHINSLYLVLYALIGVRLDCALISFQMFFFSCIDKKLLLLLSAATLQCAMSALVTRTYHNNMRAQVDELLIKLQRA